MRVSANDYLHPFAKRFSGLDQATRTTLRMKQTGVQLMG